MKDGSLARIGGWSSFAIGALSIVYAVAYLIVTPAAQRGADVAAFYASFAANPTGRQLASLCFVLTGALGPFVVAAVAERLRPAGEGWSRWALAVGTLALVATGVHGFYSMVALPAQASMYNAGDAATRAAVAAAFGMPAPFDPKELFTFGFTGLWALAVGLLTLRGADLPRWLGYLAAVAGADMLLLFGADVAGAGTLILLTGGLASLILGPVLWAGIGLTLLRGAGATAVARPGIRASSA